MASRRVTYHLNGRAIFINHWRYCCFIPLLVPIILFVSALSIPPIMNADTSGGFLVLRSMLAGGAFNTYPAPDPANIANDIVTFLTLWSPGQYLVPGIFVWFGSTYGFALSLTALIATLVGLLGWFQVGRSFAVSPFVLFLFILGLSTFAYVTLPFRVYNGGEVLLFAAAPWSLHGMRWAAHKRPMISFAISLLSMALLFFVKLSGLIVFAANVGAITLSFLLSKRRFNSSIMTMWLAAAIGTLCFIMFWLTRGPVAARGGSFALSLLPIWFSVACTTFSGMSGLDFLSWFFQDVLTPTISGTYVDWSDFYTRVVKFSYTLGPLGVLLIVWVWLKLRHTRYQDMAAQLFTVISLYAFMLALLYLRRAEISLEDRHFRYAGILFFLLLLTAIDQWRFRFAKLFASLIVIVFGLYGLSNFSRDTYAQSQRPENYDAMAGIYQEVVPPAVLDYLRSEVIRNNYQHPLAVVTSLSAAISLPGFRILYYIPYKRADGRTWAGRAEKIFVILPEELLQEGRIEDILGSFTGYSVHSWKQMNLDGMIIYTQ